MPRIKLVPIITADGRQIILQAIPQSPRERLRDLAGRLRTKRDRRAER